MAAKRVTKGDQESERSFMRNVTVDYRTGEVRFSLPGGTRVTIFRDGSKTLVYTNSEGDTVEQVFSKEGVRLLRKVTASTGRLKVLKRKETALRPLPRALLETSLRSLLGLFGFLTRFPSL